jgi:hypothetical protein
MRKPIFIMLILLLAVACIFGATSTTVLKIPLVAHFIGSRGATVGFDVVTVPVLGIGLSFRKWGSSTLLIALAITQTTLYYCLR